MAVCSVFSFTASWAAKLEPVSSPEIPIFLQFTGPCSEGLWPISFDQFVMISLNKRLSVILARPQKPDNIGLAARAMKNTGFENLLVAGMDKFERKSFVTAVHSQEILKNARFFPTLLEATSDKNIILASTSKKRKNFPLFSLDEAVSKIFDFPEKTRIGLLFGNEITGLTSEELSLANFHFCIPQFGGQPSYNLASAVLITLFSLYTYHPLASDISDEMPLSWQEQEECIQNWRTNSLSIRRTNGM